MYETICINTEFEIIPLKVHHHFFNAWTVVVVSVKLSFSSDVPEMYSAIFSAEALFFLSSY